MRESKLNKVQVGEDVEKKTIKLPGNKNTIDWKSWKCGWFATFPDQKKYHKEVCLERMSPNWWAGKKEIKFKIIFLHKIQIRYLRSVATFCNIPWWFWRGGSWGWWWGGRGRRAWRRSWRWGCSRACTSGQPAVQWDRVQASFWERFVEIWTGNAPYSNLTWL